MTAKKETLSPGLFRRIATGDPAAEAQLISDFQLLEKVRMIVDVRLNAPQQDKEDLVSDILLAILQNLRRGFYDASKSAFSTYIWAIAVNKVRDYFRPGAAKRRATSSLEDHHLMVNDSMLEKRETSRQLHNIVARLPEKYRRVLVLRYFEELTIPEISQRLGLSHSQTYNRIHYALDLIRRQKKKV